jgi:hypothetical protein
VFGYPGQVLDEVVEHVVVGGGKESDAPLQLVESFGCGLTGVTLLNTGKARNKILWDNSIRKLSLKYKNIPFSWYR